MVATAVAAMEVATEETKAPVAKVEVATAVAQVVEATAVAAMEVATEEPGEAARTALG